MRYALIFAFALRLAAGREYDPAEVISRVSRKVLATSRHIPNYTCVETVSRQYFRTATVNLPHACGELIEARQHPTLDLVLHQFATDRLRLDVAMTGQGEIFSWVGASRFDDTFMDRIGHGGPMATGVFGGLLILLFESDVKGFTFVRDTVVNGRDLMEYSFQVPKADSHYKVRAQESWVYTGYSGTIRVDPETADLVAIRVETAELPPATNECMSTFDLEYGLVTIGDSPFLLPKETRQRFVSPTGNEAENTIEFANCREYKGESTVTFGEAPPAPGERPKKAPAEALIVPPGSRFSFALTAPILSDRAAAGDPFHGRLVQPLRDPRLKVLAPTGTAVEGRLMRVESFAKPPVVVVVLRPETLTIKGARVPVTAVLDWRPVKAANRAADRRRRVIVLPREGEDHTGLFRFPGEHAIVPKGFRSDWRTVAAK